MSEIINGKQHDRNALILYGSETGNSQDVAEELGRVMERLHFITRVSEMDLVDIRELSKYTFVIFTVSTTGQGEFPKNSRKFWTSLLRKRLPPNYLSHVNFTTFGLGDSSYAKFNFAARKLHKRLEQLGGKEIYPRGEGDEQHEEGVDGTFLSWYIDLRKKLLESYPLPDGLDQIPDGVLLPPKYWLELKNESSPVTDELNSPPKNNEEGQIDQTAFKSLKNKIPPTDDLNTLNLPTTSFNHQDQDQDQGNLTIGQVDDQSQHQQSSISNKARASSSTTTTTMKDNSGLGYGYEGSTHRLTDSSNDEPESIDEKLPQTAPFPDLKGAIDVHVTDNRRVTPIDHWQDVREITFKIHLRQSTFTAGDTITIYPKNFPGDVQTLIDLMGWNDVANSKLHFHPRSPNWFGDQNLVSSQPGLHPIDDDQTLRELLTHNLDFQAIPKRHFFEIMANYTDDPMHKKRLLEFQDPVYTDEFYDYTTRPRRSILEVLQDFPSVKLPWKHASTIFPVIRGREFSISSGGIMHHPPKAGNKFHHFQILVAIVKYRTVLQKVRNGLCSRYLAAVTRGSKLTIKHNINESFYLKPKILTEAPLILIGAGTGIAPLRALLWDRSKQRTQSPEEQQALFGMSYLIYGGRNRAADYFYEMEWGRLSRELSAFPVFSRDGPQKVYVQDEITRRGKGFCELLMKHNALVYVCGSSGGMPKGVRFAFLNILRDHGGLSDDEAEAYLADLERLKRFGGSSNLGSNQVGESPYGNHFFDSSWQFSAGFLLAPAFISSIYDMLCYAMLGEEPEVERLTMTLELLARSTAPSMQTNIVTAAAAAYTNCCEHRGWANFPKMRLPKNLLDLEINSLP
ncbi:NAPDH-dependent diflavin reductase [Ciborinia camelliae]|nr:NAPDH-dependent diflavin reductase [Ciborinia camelliae]